MTETLTVPENGQVISVPKSWAVVERMEKSWAEFPQVECPLTHNFAPGIYIRQIFMPAITVDGKKGTIVTSRIHKFRHPFFISSGVVSFWTDEDGWSGKITGPYSGITEAGTRRILCVYEDTTWTTFHHNPTEEKNPDILEDMLTFPHHITRQQIKANHANKKEFLCQ